MIAAGVLVGAAGFIVPGLLVARRLQADLRWGSAFILSLLLLFHAVFWTGVLGQPVRWTAVAGVLFLLTAFAWMLAGRIAMAGSRDTGAPSTPGTLALRPGGWEYLVGAGACAVGAAVLLRATLAPVPEWDNPFRWQHLAEVILSTGSFSFYPPLTAGDFANYFMVDAIPPLVPFSYWWIYASAGRILPALTGGFVAAQFMATVGFAAAGAARLFGPRAGWWAAGVLAGAQLFVNSIAMGQETGLTALSAAATVAFLARDGERRGPLPVVMAGLSTALGILAREYCWSFLIVGAVMLLWRRSGMKRVLLYVAVAVAVAVPWYARNIALTGNPFFSTPLCSFPVNPVFAKMLQFYRETLGVSTWGGTDWASILRFLLLTAAIPILAGVMAIAAAARRHGYLGLATLTIFLLWLSSVGYTSGGPEYAARMLSPALVLLAVGAGGLLARAASRPMAGAAIGSAVAAALGWSLLSALAHPYDPAGIPPDHWREAILRPYESRRGKEWENLRAVLPPGSRVLGDNAYLYAWLRPRGFQLVPVWSPEVAFIDDPSLPVDEIRRQLGDLGIRHVWFEDGLNGRFLRQRVRFYREDTGNWRTALETGAGSLLEIPAAARSGDGG